MTDLEDLEASLYALRRRLFDEFQIAKAAQDTAKMRQLEDAAGLIDDDLKTLALSQLQTLANRLTLHARKVNALTRVVSAWPFGNATIAPPAETPQPGSSTAPGTSASSQPSTTTVNEPATTPTTSTQPATTTAATSTQPATTTSTTLPQPATTPQTAPGTTLSQPATVPTGVATGAVLAISATQFAKIFPQAPNPDEWASAVSEAWKLFGITSKDARAGFLGITGNETGGYVTVRRERMNYTPQRAVQVWPGKAGDTNGNPTATCRARCAAGEEAFANWIYAGIIGNGNEASGDGWKYRGGGIIQLTGRANYRACGVGLGIPQLEDRPEAVTNHALTSAAAAAWFMAKYAHILDDLNKDSESNFLEAARKVGLPPDSSAVERRLDYRRRALAIL